MKQPNSKINPIELAKQNSEKLVVQQRQSPTVFSAAAAASNNLVIKKPAQTKTNSKIIIDKINQISNRVLEEVKQEGILRKNLKRSSDSYDFHSDDSNNSSYNPPKMKNVDTSKRRREENSKQLEAKNTVKNSSIIITSSSTYANGSVETVRNNHSIAAITIPWKHIFSKINLVQNVFNFEPNLFLSPMNTARESRHIKKF